MRRFVIIMLALSVVIAGLLSYFASTEPDGLERVAEDSGFIDLAEEPALKVLPDYSVPGFGAFASNALAGLIGVIATFGVVYLGARIAARKKQRG